MDMSDTACVVPWSNLVIQPDGVANFCCDAPLALSRDGRKLRFGPDSLEDLWNADELVDTRAAMARGERPAVCELCWRHEERGVRSRRQVMNGQYAVTGGTLPLTRLGDVGAETGYRLERRPDWFLLELGGLCNLRCRSCHPLFSSRIAADPLHVAWNDSRELVGDSQGRRAPLPVRDAAWFGDVDSMADAVASGAGENAILSLIGGEPFLIKQSWQLLEGLVERGVAQNIYVGICTNGQQRSEKLAELAPAFRGFALTVSIDGYGPLYEYLRHGGDWPRLVENLDWFAGIEGASVAVTVTLQNTNALDLPRLLRFLEDRQLRLNYNVLSTPERLGTDNLPPEVRRVAAARLREYLALECLPFNAEVIRSYCEHLDSPRSEFDPDLLTEFMTFTNDLDQGRGESIREAAPELVGLIEAAGYPWSSDTRHIELARTPAAVTVA
jgi:MoaA/NifB/PqqE/SkfB family radical SAM enzyme